jgi:hypothetical protein
MKNPIFYFALALGILCSAKLFAGFTDNDTIILSRSMDMANDTIIEAITDQDTTIIRIGKKDFIIIEHKGGTEIKTSDTNSKKNKSKKFNGKFDGHWQGIELGYNAFDNEDYSMYGVDDFMSLNQGKSSEFNLNLFELNIGLHKNYIGLVSGIGFSFNSYRFEYPYTLLKGDTRVEPVVLTQSNLIKSKLTLDYLTAPLLLEFQIPVNYKADRIYISTGVIGGIRIGSHTKIKHGDIKEKDHSDFYVNLFKYSATARVGFNNISLFANYGLNNVFEKGRGPELTPFTIGFAIN